ncbi:hypothetical protein IMZ31_22125 (plasmid) [Pontibacillus sp. ALD_SL1]|uniref:PIN domain-containing protein n=1 Tax=Pontibacillus sp. ALD_SL1 TaxID=2777185 RepID=UPI001A959945|nr:PIN domain-containing protein [Pontibacillus sp. ALD_SL1]QST02152.1 hypothetical protein IMZ31_22125 [Pontibacillus sp. ALD_SL1]
MQTVLGMAMVFGVILVSFKTREIHSWFLEGSGGGEWYSVFFTPYNVLPGLLGNETGVSTVVWGVIFSNALCLFLMYITSLVLFRKSESLALHFVPPLFNVYLFGMVFRHTVFGADVIQTQGSVWWTPLWYLGAVFTAGPVAYVMTVHDVLERIKERLPENPYKGMSMFEKEETRNTIKEKRRIVDDQEYTYRRFEKSYAKKRKRDEMYECRVLGSHFTSFKDEHDGVKVGIPFSVRPLHAIGVRSGDLITGVNDTPIHTVEDLFDMEPNIGDVYKLDLVRDGEPFVKYVYLFDFDEDGSAITAKVETVLKEAFLRKQQGYSIGVDTNVMLKYPFLIKALYKDFPFVISKTVFDELDKQKTRDDLGHQVRNALRAIEEVQERGGRISEAPEDKRYAKKKKLNPDSNDDLIIGSYMQEQEKGNKVLFLSEDRGARITSRLHGLETISFEGKRSS